jgi:hypothetical protein
MSDEIAFNVDLMFGHIELHDAPPRIEGPYLILRHRTIWKDRYGNVTKDETTDGVRVTGWEDSAHLFGVAAPPRPKTWMQRVYDYFF